MIEGGGLYSLNEKKKQIRFAKSNRRRHLTFRKESSHSKKHQSKSPEYKFFTEFQSHEPEFDYLKSLEIEEKINKIKWCKRQNNAHFLISTNGKLGFVSLPSIIVFGVLWTPYSFPADKTIKLWKIYEKKIKAMSSMSHSKEKTLKGAKDLVIPTIDTRETVIAATPRRTFANAHAYHINSISLNSDGETYISSDDLRINLWNLSISDQSFSKSFPNINFVPFFLLF